VTTNSTFFNTDSPKTVRDVLNFLNDDLGVDAMMISPAYAYEKAPDQEHFLGVEQTRELFRKAFGDKQRKKWRLNHSPLFLDFLEGKVDFQCTAWASPAIRSSAGSDRATSWRTDMPPPTKNWWKPPTGTPMEEGRIPGVRTAWRTAAMSPRPS